ncbi:signal peptidase II [Roseibium album]|uniref:Lipoprotein signal peptidase n=1 Tax=Roseibium album TaxID=311410 RepID=A0A0M6ZPR5_9HYPH|nr:signal peptidase II [Roseibium album]CTQ61037.1 Lipoprotein signal peptidase [Roseibium album]CTQ64166.1 Lipoprotein signal peptidase [Roseibium album]CTQ72589.1 Lipoprotein signal peptidase [Roseibium album]
MSEPTQIEPDTAGQPLLWGRFSGIVFVVALAGLVLDQVSKLWLLYGFELGTNGPVELFPVLEFVLVWNRGVSYGLFQQDGDTGRWLLAGLTVAITIGLWVWSARCQTKLVAFALALVIGGAIGNGIDRIAYGAVVDFVHFHVGTFSWYVFNLADVWIVAGVVALLYDSFRIGPNSAAK